MNIKRIYETKQSAYYKNEREELIGPLGDTNGKIVLELGCGHGATLLTLKKRYPRTRVVGIDIVSPSERATLSGAGVEYRQQNIEDEKISDLEGLCDFIICGDILEHLIDPWSAVAKIKSLLKPEGLVIFSVPNVANLRTVAALVFKDEFKYRESGVLDRTHLRFFTKSSIEQIAKDVGFSILHVRSKSIDQSIVKTAINALTLRIFEPLMTLQYIFVMQK
jgi:2-polyprenyl-3-methyl-5-hydroxy-6-metoxy-1,4-benzoquinol methylase